jgi:hypothetical protein
MRCPGILLAAFFLATSVTRADGTDVRLDAATLLRMSGADHRGLTEVTDPLCASGSALEAGDAFQLQVFKLDRLLQPGWYRMRLRVRLAAPPTAIDALSFAFWCPNGVHSPSTFRYETTFVPAELPRDGRYGDVVRTLYLGPSFGNYGLSLKGFKGVCIESICFLPQTGSVSVTSVHVNKLLYGLRESGTVAVRILNSTGQPQKARLTVNVESGLDDEACLLDREMTFVANPSTGVEVIELPLPPQPEYGHAVVATIHQGDSSTSARDYFFTSDRPAQIGHLGIMGIEATNSPVKSAQFVDRQRRFCFPMYEIVFWAPDDVLGLVPPGKDYWWSGQTLAQVTLNGLKDRIRLGHDQGMKVLSYTDLRLDFGFRTAEAFRQHPEYCEWDANDNDMAYEVAAVRRQARESDAERFDPRSPNKPKFKAKGVWRPATGNPDLVDAHIDQLVRSAKTLGWDGFRYDDHYDYDAPATDLLGRPLPKGGWRNPAIVARIRSALEKAKPGMIYGHNLEWAQDEPLRAEEPMPIDTPPHANDYYTEFLRDGGLHLQERYLARMISRHAPWTQVRDYLLTLGHNAYRRGGCAYGLSYLNNARPADARYLAALHFAGLTHLAGGINDSNLGQMRLACRHADLLFGDRIVPLLDDEKVLQVDAGGRELWWKHYVRYREVAPGRRVYFVHLINPPRTAKIGDGDPRPSDPVTNVVLNWKLPPGWKAKRAYQLSGEGDTSIDTVVSGGTWAQETRDLVGYGLYHKVAALRDDGSAARVTVPGLQVWSIVALDCRGPVDDVAPDVRFPLPPLPAGTVANWGEATTESPIRCRLSYDISDPKGWTRPDPANPGKRVPLATVPDPAATDGRAARCVNGWELEAYRPGGAIEDGTYRISFRVKATARVPADSKLTVAAWCPMAHKQSWHVERSVPLDKLSVDAGWQMLSTEADFGYGWENLGLRVKGGFDGLLIDWIKLEEIRRLPDSVRLKSRGLNGWPSELRLTPHDGLRVWLGDGLYTEHYKLDDALRSIPDSKVAVAGHWTYREQRGFNGAGWTKPEDVAGYDLIVLSNVDLKSMPLERRDWIRGYVQAGGSLLMLGGPYGLGRGCWQESDLVEPLLPVKLHNYDLRPMGLHIPLPLSASAGGFLTNGWPDQPATLWLHDVEPKSGATVHLNAGDHPALVTGTYGKGRVAVLAVTPLGETPAGTLVWWQWPGWNDVMTKTLQWLVRKDGAR